MDKICSTWKKPARFDRNLAVIGAGTGGLISAYVASSLKARVTLIEKNRMGGNCTNTGCVPSKALIRSAKLLSHMARSKEFGIASARAEFDFAAVMERVQSVIRAIAPHDSVEHYTGLGVDVVQGSASIISPWQVDIACADGTRRSLATRSIIIAAGTRPLVPSIPGIDEVGYLTSDTLWDLRALPRRLLVLGGGPLGTEMGQAFARFGAQVTLLELGSRIMQREDPEVSDFVARRFAVEGISVLVNHRAKRFVIENGDKTLIAEHDGNELRIPFDTVLVATGRTANLTDYGLEALGIPTDGLTLETNAYLQTRYPSIYAVGDVTGPFQFSHTAAQQAWYATLNGLFAPFRKFKTDNSVIPWATFVDPEVARVGLNEQEARQKGIPYEVTRYDLEELDRAIIDGETRGFIKVLTVPGKDKILGATIVGANGGEMIAEFVLAMKHDIGLSKFLWTIHICPTMSEATRYVSSKWTAAHTSVRLLSWVERFHTWRRG